MTPCCSSSLFVVFVVVVELAVTTRFQKLALEQLVAEQIAMVPLALAVAAFVAIVETVAIVRIVVVVAVVAAMCRHRPFDTVGYTLVPPWSS